MSISTENVQSDEDFLKEALAELGIDLSKPRCKHKSKLPRNRLGLPVIPKGSAGKTLLQMYREERGLC